MDALPAYAQLTQLPQTSQQQQQQPLWLADAVLAARMQFLLQVLVPCMPVLAQVRPSLTPTSTMIRALCSLFGVLL